MPTALISKCSLPSPPKTSLKGTIVPERPSEATFETTDFRFYLAHRETFQNLRGSKVITTRRFRPIPRNEGLMSWNGLLQFSEKYSAPGNLA